MKDFECKGQWWLPGNPDHRVGGSLSFSQSLATTLDLLGLFESFDDYETKHPLILGESTDGKKITLQDCLLKRISTRSSTYLSHNILDGVHLESQEDLKFRCIGFGLTDLYEWLGKSGIRVSFNPSEDEHQRISYVETPDMALKFGDAAIKIDLAASFSFGFPKSSVQEEACWFIELSEALQFEELLDTYVVPLTNFLTLASGRRNFVENLFLLSEPNSPVPIQVFHRQIAYETRTEEDASRHEMVFSFPDIEDRFEQILTEWFRASAELKVINRLFARERSSSGLFLDLRFLTICHALELFHRSRFDSSKGADYIKLKKEIISTVAEGHRDWVSSLLDNWNAKTLLERFADLLTDRKELFEPLVGDVQLFAEKAKKARNYYTHFSGKQRLDDLAFLLLTETLSLLLQSCLLFDIGISNEEQAAMFRNSKQYSFVKLNAATLKAALKA